MMKASLTVPQLLSRLQSSFSSADLVEAERILSSREQSMRAEIERDFLEEITLKEVDNIELERILKEEEEKSAALAAKLEESEKGRVFACEAMEKYKSLCERCLKQNFIDACFETDDKVKKGKLDDCSKIQNYESIRSPVGTRFSPGIDASSHGHGNGGVATTALGVAVETSGSKDDNMVEAIARKDSEMIQEGNVGAVSDDNDEGPLVFTPKRKCLSKIVTSDSEDEDEDNGSKMMKPRDQKNEGVVENDDEGDGSEVMRMNQKNLDAVGDDDNRCTENFLSTPTPKIKGDLMDDDGDTEEDDDNDDRIPLIKLLQMNQKNQDAAGDSDNLCGKSFLSFATPKRKCTSTVVTGDYEDDDDDDRIGLIRTKSRKGMEGEASNGSPVGYPFGCNNTQHGAIPYRRCLVPLHECVNKTKHGEISTSSRDSIPHNLSPAETKEPILRNRGNVRQKLKFVDTESSKDDFSESEGESLDGFIVDACDDQESDSTSMDAFGEDEQSDDDIDLTDVLAKIRREKDNKSWEYEADMLSSFSEDPELCMKALCALYRQQTCEEKSYKATIVKNNRGFSQLHAKSGSQIAEFLLDGDPNSPLKKTVQELHECFPLGLGYCYKMATYYSKQLFTIYQNREDPFFL